VTISWAESDTDRGCTDGYSTDATLGGDGG
jgi:hypothetical protein